MAIESFQKEWAFIKANFTKATGKKKPSEKFLGVFNKNTGLTPACTKLDIALAKPDPSGATKALADLKKVAGDYVRILAKAATEKSDATLSAETKVMIGELNLLLNQGEKAVEAIQTPPPKAIQPPPPPKTLPDLIKLLQHKQYGLLITAQAKKTHNTEQLRFLMLMGAKVYTKKTYDEHIVEKSPYEINISGTLRKKFDPSDLSSAPWNEATTSVLNDFLGYVIMTMPPWKP
jgi:hypothetical protein